MIFYTKAEFQYRPYTFLIKRIPMKNVILSLDLNLTQENLFFIIVSI